MRAFLTALLVLVTAVLMQPASAVASSRAKSAQDISSPPPPPIYEIDVGERAGYIRTPGYWRWNGKRHVWNASRWIAARDDAQWVPDQWEQHGQKWHFAAGHWEDEPVEAEETDELDEQPSSKAFPTAKNKPLQAKKINYHNHRIWPKVMHR